MRKPWAAPVLIGLFLVLQASAAQAVSTFAWTDPQSGGQVDLSVTIVDNGGTQDWIYTIDNLSYDPSDPFEGDANGLSAFQILFSEPVAEVANIMGPAGWATTATPDGINWSILSSQGEGIGIGESGAFSFTTLRREIVTQTAAQGQSYMNSFRDFDQASRVFRGTILVPGALDPSMGAPIPEPGAATLFVVGLLVVGRAASRSRRL